MIYVYKGSKIYGAELKRFLESQGTNFVGFNCSNKDFYYGVADGRVSAYFRSDLTEKHVIKEFDNDLWED